MDQNDFAVASQAAAEGRVKWSDEPAEGDPFELRSEDDRWILLNALSVAIRAYREAAIEAARTPAGVRLEREFLDQIKKAEDMRGRIESADI